MIGSFRHKGLRLLFENNDPSKLPPQLIERIGTILSFLDAAGVIADMDQPTFRLHQLKGDRKRQLGVHGPRQLAHRLSL